jgi:hypothetical protein
MDLSAVKGRKITPEEQTYPREGGLCIYCGNSRHITASCQRKMKAASGQEEVRLFRDSGKEKDMEKTVEKKVESGKD